MGWVKTLIVAIVLIGALLVAADRVGAYEAEQLMSNKLASSYQLGQQPTVHVKGFPFLTQWASGNYQEIDVDLGTATAGGVQLSNVSAQMLNVTMKGFATSGQDIRGAQIGWLNLRGTIAYTSLPIPNGFQVAPDGTRLKLTGSFSAFGQSLPVTALISVTTDQGRLVLNVDDVQTANSYITQVAKAAITQQIQSRAFLQQLPLGVHLDSASVTASGLQITASARQVTLPSAVPTAA